MKKFITIAGVELSEEQFPKLYKMAQAEPVSLEAKLRSLSQSAGGTLEMAAILYENDLQHGTGSEAPDLPDWV